MFEISSKEIYLRDGPRGNDFETPQVRACEDAEARSDKRRPTGLRDDKPRQACLLPVLRNAKRAGGWESKSPKNFQAGEGSAPRKLFP